MTLLHLAAFAAAALGAPECYAAAHDIPAGTPLTAGDLVVVSCKPGTQRAALRYDSAARSPIAVLALPAGTYLGRLMPLPDRQVAAGEPLTLRSTAGPVTIERRVVAMQPGRPGEKLFVRDADGQVFSVRYSGEGAE